MDNRARHKPEELASFESSLELAFCPRLAYKTQKERVVCGIFSKNKPCPNTAIATKAIPHEHSRFSRFSACR